MINTDFLVQIVITVYKGGQESPTLSVYSHLKQGGGSVMGFGVMCGVGNLIKTNHSEHRKVLSDFFDTLWSKINAI